MNKKQRVLMVCTILALILLTSCAYFQQIRSHGGRVDIQNETNSDVYTYDLQEKSKQLTLDIEITASQGTFYWLLSDPNGDAAWQGSLQAVDQTSQQVELEVIPGQWKLEVTMEQASGSYDIEWRSR